MTFHVCHTRKMCIAGDTGYTTPFRGSIADMLTKVSNGKMVLSRNNGKVVTVNIAGTLQGRGGGTGCPGVRCVMHTHE